MNDFQGNDRDSLSTYGISTPMDRGEPQHANPGTRLSRRGILRGAATLFGTAVIMPHGLALAAPVSSKSLSPLQLETELAALDKPIYILETAMPETFAVSKGELSISDAHAKIGGHSLRWNYRAGSQLTVQTDLHIGTAEANETDYFAVWLYNESAVEDQLRLQFGRGDRVDAWQDVSLDFTGWRTVWLRYGQDLEGYSRPAMDRITLVAPGTAGELWIDQLVTNVSVRPDRPLPDLQVPDIAPNLSEAPNFHWLGLLTYWHLQQDPGFNSTGVSAREIEDAQKIYGRLLERQRRDRDYGPDALADLEQKFAEFGIPYLADPDADGDGLRPASVGSFVYDKQLEVIPDEYRAAIIDISGGKRLRDLWDDLGLLTAMTWDTAHRDGDKEAAQRAGQLVLRLMVHLLDQGWSAGSGQGTIHHIGYTIRSWVDALLLLEPLLRERGLWKRCSEALEWYVGTGRLTYDFSEQSHRSGLVDVLNTLLEGMLTTCFVPASWEEKVGRLRAFRQWIDHAHSYSPGLAGGYKPDGSVYHHNGPYTLYGRDGLKGSIPVLLDAAGTVFALSPAGQRVLTTALRHQVLLANTLDYPLSQSGRHQTGTMNIRGLVNPHALLGRSPLDGSDGFDEYHASMFRHLVPRQDPSSWMLKMDRRFADAGIEKAVAPNGYWGFPYSATGLRRQEDWQVTVRGHNRYIWTAEIYQQANLYGRYQTYGQVTVLSDTDGDEWVELDSDNGVVVPGYDWNFIPGTTTKTLPFDQLKADLGGTVESMALTESSFGGAGILDSHACLFGMELKEHPAYDPTHTARISALMVGDRVIALGSGVRNSDRQHPTRTTLFQVSPDVMAQPHKVVAGNDWIVDPADNGYVVMDGPALKYKTGSQASPDQDGAGEATGNFSLAYLDHGSAPHDSGYAYVMLVKGAVRRTAALAGQLHGDASPILIMQRDRVAHVVTDVESSVTAHTIFEPDTELTEDSVVRAASRQALVLSRPRGKGRGVAFSITDPDVHLYRGRDEEQYRGDVYVGDESPYTRWWQHNESIPMETTVLLRGRWRALQPQGATNLSLRYVDDDVTAVTVTNQHGASVEFSLSSVDEDDEDRDNQGEDRDV